MLAARNARLNVVEYLLTEKNADAIYRDEVRIFRFEVLKTYVFTARE
jgi:hypothetical protein